MQTTLSVDQVRIKCHLSRFMGERKMKVINVARATGLNRNTITLLYKETSARVEMDTIIKLCLLFDCTPGELFTLETQS